MERVGMFLPTDTSVNVPDDWGSVTWSFVTKITKYVPGEIGWIARQQNIEDNQWTNVWGFVVGNKFGAADLDAMRNADDAFVRQVATEMLGYAPDSVQDLENRRLEAESKITDINHQIQDLVNNRTYFERILANIESRIASSQHQPNG